MGAASYLAPVARSSTQRPRNVFELTQKQWEAISPLLPGKPGDPGRTGVDNRQFVDAVLWVLGNRARWCHLPPELGSYKTVHKRFKRWEAKGVWKKVFARLGTDLDTGLPAFHAPVDARQRPGVVADSVFDLPAW